MRTLCIFFGLAAICSRLNLGVVFSPFIWSTVSDAISIAAGAAISAWLIASCRLVERVASPQWIVAAFGAAGALALLGKYFSGPLALWALLNLGIEGSSELHSVLEGLFLLCFLKVTADLTPAAVVAPAEDPGIEPSVRILLALMLFLGATFSLVPSGIAVAAALSKQSLDPLTGLGLLAWAIDGAIAAGFIAYAKVRARLPDNAPGLNLMTFALVVNLGLAAVMAQASSERTAGEIAMVLVAFGMFAGPIVVAANLLLAVGLFKVLFNLAPPRQAEVPDTAPAEPAALEAVHVSPLPRAGPPPPPPSAEDRAQAIVRARANLAAKPGDSMLHQQLHQRLLADPAQQSAMLDHAREYLAVLLKQSNGALALSVLQACVERDPAFKPSTDQVVPLAKIAMSSGQGALALRIMNQFDRLNPGHAATPAVYFLSARALRDLKHLDQARSVLDAMLARYPNDPLAFDARALRKGLERP